MRSMRHVEGEIRYVRLCDRPSTIPRQRRAPRGVKGLGLRYEAGVGREISRLLPNVYLGQWLEWKDDCGVRYCQPDVFHTSDDRVVAFECKLTEVEEARMQLTGLYLPLLRALYARPALGVVVVKHLSRETCVERVVDSFEGALYRAQEDIPTLHWLGRGRL